MDCIKIVWFTGLIVGFITWFLTKTFTELEYEKKWRLGICHDTETGWQPLLERNLDNHHWEYIYINKKNLPLIGRLAYSKVPKVPLPSMYASSEEDPIYKMLQDMVNRGHGSITGIKKEETFK